MVVIGPMVVIYSAPLASIAGGVLPTFKHCPTLFNEHPCLTQRKVQNVAFATIGHVDSIELVREFLREPDFHGRKETSNTRALLHLKIQNARPKLGILMRRKPNDCGAIRFREADQLPHSADYGALAGASVQRTCSDLIVPTSAGGSVA